MERGAVPLCGVPAFGVHVNGYVATADGPRLWVGRRAKHKMVAPGKLDHLVAGGQPYGLGLMENVGTEAQEEPSIPADLPERARPDGALRYLCERGEGPRNDVLLRLDLAMFVGFLTRQPDEDVGEVSLEQRPKEM